MNSDRIVLLLVTILIVLSMILISGVGYAVETGNTLKISDNASLEPGEKDFSIAFSGEPICRGKGLAQIMITGKTTATINISELEKAGDSVLAIFTIENKSDYLYADICADVTNTNTEYFNVNATLSDYKISPQNGETKLEINVELLKTPIDKEESASICIKIFASPSYSK